MRYDYDYGFDMDDDRYTEVVELVSPEICEGEIEGWDDKVTAVITIHRKYFRPVDWEYDGRLDYTCTWNLSFRSDDKESLKRWDFWSKYGFESEDEAFKYLKFVTEHLTTEEERELLAKHNEDMWHWNAEAEAERRMGA